VSASFTVIQVTFFLVFSSLFPSYSGSNDRSCDLKIGVPPRYTECRKLHCRPMSMILTIGFSTCLHVLWLSL